MPPNSYHHCFTSDEYNITIQFHLIFPGKIYSNENFEVRTIMKTLPGEKKQIKLKPRTNKPTINFQMSISRRIFQESPAESMHFVKKFL